jgi:hypothetical protein
MNNRFLSQINLNQSDSKVPQVYSNYSARLKCLLRDRSQLDAFFMLQYRVLWRLARASLVSFRGERSCSPSFILLSEFHPSRQLFQPILTVLTPPSSTSLLTSPTKSCETKNLTKTCLAASNNNIEDRLFYQISAVHLRPASESSGICHGF